LDARLRRITVFLSIVFSAGMVLGEGTHSWEQSKFDDLSKGTADGVAIRSMGGLELAPAFKALCTTPSTYIWAIAADRDGTLYAAAGSPARVYRITSDGQSTVIFQPQELQVQTLVVDKSGAIYAATNPDGKIYKLEHHAASKAEAGKSGVDPSWGSSVYFDPGTKYIWSLVVDDAGNLYAATGDQGQVFRVTPKGEHTVFFKSDETHVRVLALDGQGNLIAGSDGSGLIYRISPNGDAFVLYSTPKKEITALAIDPAGNIYAAGAGEKHGGTAAATITSVPVTTTAAPQPAANSPQPGGGIVITGIPAGTQSMPSSFPSPAAGASAGSEIYRVVPDGSPSRIWTSHDDLVYALAFDQHGRLLAGTGNRGHVFAISGEDEFTDLVKASATQVTAFASAPGGGLYVSTSNLGKVFVLGATPAAEGSYESDVFDARIFSRWGRAEFRGAGNVELFARSGNVDNPDRNWSPWTRVDPQKDSQVSVPPARFIQWKSVLRAGEVAPRLDRVAINYLPKNVPPDFDEVAVQVGVRYQPLPKTQGGDIGGQPRFDAPPPALRDPNSVGVRWNVHDDNDDQMVYSVYYRPDGESRWLLLKDNLSDKFYSFDSSLLPDGGYTVKVVASDAPSHSADQALSAERESAYFEVDTTPPRIEDLRAWLDGEQIHVNFRAIDGFSNIKRAEYSVDANDWQFVEPVGQLSDSRTESYDFKVPALANAPVPGRAAAKQLDHVVVVRVSDRFDNVVSAKTILRSK